MKYVWILLSILHLVLCQTDFEVVVFSNFTSFTIDSSTELVYSNIGQNILALNTPYTYTAMGEVLTCSISYTNPVLPVQAALIINSTHGPVLEVELGLTHNSTNFTLPTVGPCQGNGFTFKGEQIASTLTFVKNANDYIVSCIISRAYQNASIGLGTNYWMNFLPGLNNYYIINLPTFNSATPTGLKVIITRIKPTLPAPKLLFSVLALGTQQKCFNTGIPDDTLPGVIEQFVPVSDNSPNIDILSHVFETPLTSKTAIYLEFGVFHNASSTPSIDALYHGYTVNFSTVGIPTPVSPPAPISAGTVFAIVCGVLVILGALGIVYYFCTKRKANSYSSLG